MMNPIDEIFKVSKLIVEESMSDLNDNDRELLNSWKNKEDNLKIYDEVKSEVLYVDRNQKLQQFDATKAWKGFVVRMDKQNSTNERRKKKLAFRFSPIAAIFLIGLFTYMSVVIWQKYMVANDILIEPGHYKAELIVDGQVFKLEDQIKHINKQGVRIRNEKGKLIYNSKNNTDSLERSPNKLIVPRGGEYQLILSDGTKVWLNSETELSYPEQFTSEERRVSLTGEAYFEVTKNQNKPFIVESGSIEIKVLGTSFNVRNYAEEKVYATTLVEGSVELLSKNREFETTLLMPGYQFKVNKETNKSGLLQVNLKEYVSWKDGVYTFKHKPLSDVLNELSRWYDVRIIYADHEIGNKTITGNFKRSQNFNEFIELVNKIEVAELHIEERTIIVSEK